MHTAMDNIMLNVYILNKRESLVQHGWKEWKEFKFKGEKTNENQRNDERYFFILKRIILKGTKSWMGCVSSRNYGFWIN